MRVSLVIRTSSGLDLSLSASAAVSSSLLTKQKQRGSSLITNIMSNELKSVHFKYVINTEANDNGLSKDLTPLGP